MAIASGDSVLAAINRYHGAGDAAGASLTRNAARAPTSSMLTKSRSGVAAA
jgi:hypothetical protein